MIKNSIKLLFASVVLLLFSSCNKCKKNCENGTCVEKECICLDGWIGEYCENQITPQYIIVDSIVVHSFSDVRYNGKTWDDEAGNEDADLIIWWCFGGTISYYPDIITSQVYDNAKNNKSYSFTEDFPLKIPSTDFEKTSNLYVGDLDSEQNLVEFIEGYNFNLYSDKNNFPSSKSFNNLETKYSIYLSYQFSK